MNAGTGEQEHLGAGTAGVQGQQEQTSWQEQEQQEQGLQPRAGGGNCRAQGNSYSRTGTAGRDSAAVTGTEEFGWEEQNATTELRRSSSPIPIIIIAILVLYLL